MKNPRYWVGFILALIAWSIAIPTSWLLMLAAWLMDKEKDLQEFKEELDEKGERHRPS